MREEKLFILAAGGYLTKPIVEEITINESEMEDDYEDFEEYKSETLENATAEYEIRFASAIVLTEEQAKEIGKILVGK
jgi:hypothetical protein